MANFLAAVKAQDKSHSKGQDAKASPTEKADKANRTNKEAVRGDPEKGKAVFESNCSICYEVTEDDKVGLGLKGIFKKEPHKLSDGTEDKVQTVEVIRKQIVNGGGSMPPVGSSLNAHGVYGPFLPHRKNLVRHCNCSDL